MKKKMRSLSQNMKLPCSVAISHVIKIKILSCVVYKLEIMSCWLFQTY